MGHVVILQGSIGYACGPVLMIPHNPHRVKGLCFELSGQAAGCNPHPAAGFQLWMWGLTNDGSKMTATTHHGKSRFLV
jgi:hypothetical protein